MHERRRLRRSYSKRCDNKFPTVFVLILFPTVQDILNSFGGSDRADFAGCIVRMAGHDMMDFDPTAPAGQQGGVDACIDFTDPDNAGLSFCIQQLQPAYSHVCHKMSLADFMVIAAEACDRRNPPDHGCYSSEPGFQIAVQVRPHHPARVQLGDWAHANSRAWVRHHCAKCADQFR